MLYITHFFIVADSFLFAVMKTSSTYRNYVCNAAVQIALIILDGYWPIFFDSFHGQWAVQLQKNKNKKPPNLY